MQGQRKPTFQEHIGTGWALDPSLAMEASSLPIIRIIHILLQLITHQLTIPQLTIPQLTAIPGPILSLIITISRILSAATRARGGSAPMGICQKRLILPDPALP